MKLRMSLLIAIFAVYGCSGDEDRKPGGITQAPPLDMAQTASDAGDAGNSDSGGGNDVAVTPDMNPPPDMNMVEPDMGGPDMCVPETDAEMCARYGFECGPLQDLDNCGDMRTIDSCGDEVTVCSMDQSCGGGGVPGQCGCTVATCSDLGVLCGQVADTCGGTLNCDLFCVDEISAGDKHGCAIGSGSIKCWGNGGDGALGTGRGTTEKNPADVVGLTTTVTHVAAGGHHTCIIDSSQRVLCWGKNDRSQLGIGTTVDSNQPGTPAIFAGADLVVAGDEHNCALSNDKLECWGSNEFGQIGDPSFNINANVGVPTVPLGLDANVTAVTAGKNHTCVIQDDPGTGQMGLLKCWGRNRFAQIQPLPLDYNFINDATLMPMPAFGYKTTPGWDLSSLVGQPTIVNDANGMPLTGVKAVSAGADHTCYINSADEVWCMGMIPGFEPATSCPKIENKVPKLCSVFPRPNGVLVTKVSDVGALSAVEGMWVANVPQQIPTTYTPVELASGDDHSCMRVSDPGMNEGNIHCWGNSAYGQVGDGTNNHWTDPRLVITDTDGDFVLATQIDLGGRHSCALVDNSNINCWGSNAASQIGNSDLMRDESYRPFDVRLEVVP